MRVRLNTSTGLGWNVMGAKMEAMLKRSVYESEKGGGGGGE